MSALNEWLRKRSAAGLYCMSWLTQAFKIGIGSSAETTMLKSAALSLVSGILVEEEQISRALFSPTA